MYSSATRSALEVLLEGAAQIKPQPFPGIGLAAMSMLMALGIGREETITTIMVSGGGTGVDFGQKELGRVLILQSQGKWNEAAEVAKTASLKLPGYPLLALHQAFCCLCAGDNSAAEQAFVDYQRPIDLGGSPHFWLRSFVQLRLGHLDEARNNLRSYLLNEISVPAALDEKFLLRLWDGQVASRRPIFSLFISHCYLLCSRGNAMWLDVGNMGLQCSLTERII